MATKEEPVAGGGGGLTPPRQQLDSVKQEVKQEVAAPTVSVSTVYSDASPPPHPLSPQHQFPAVTLQGVYPKAIATQDAVVADEKLFMETFYSLHTALKSKPTIPKMGGKDLDLHLLYKEVSSRGGLQAVTNSRKWKEITLVFDFPSTTTSASYVLRKYYTSLLHHYEQVYRNGMTGALIPPPASSHGSSPSVQSAEPALSEGAEPVVRKRVRKRRTQQPPVPAVDPAEAIGATVTGAIEGKLDFGYIVTMVVGGENLKGILYHVPPGHKGPQFATLPSLANSMNAELIGTGAEITTRRKRRRKEEMPKKDPNAPRPNRTGYNFFFAEQRQRLKALHPDKDREISRMIGEAWNNLSDADKLPYQDRGQKDKERFKREFRDYREKLRIGYYDNPANGQGQGLGDETAASENPANAHHSSQVDQSRAMAIDTAVATVSQSLPKQEPSNPLEQLQIDQKPSVASTQ